MSSGTRANVCVVKESTMTNNDKNLRIGMRKLKATLDYFNLNATICEEEGQNRCATGWREQAMPLRVIHDAIVDKQYDLAKNNIESEVKYGIDNSEIPEELYRAIVLNNHS